MKKIKKVFFSFVSICLMNVVIVQSVLAGKPGQGLLKTENADKSYNLSQEEEQGEETNVENRSIIISGEIDSTVACLVISQLLYLEKQNPAKDITMYINSQGGSVTDGMAIYDVMRYVKCDVSTVCIGTAASMGAFLLASGTKGKRFALKNSVIMIHKPNSPIAPVAALSSPNLASVTSLIITILAENTGKKYEEVDKDTSKDYFMTASEAKEYGIIDEVLQN